MSDFNLTLEDITCLMEKFSQTNLGELSIEAGTIKLSISAKQTAAAANTAAVSCQSLPVQAASPVQAAADTEEKITGNVMKAPIVGTFYAAVSPDKPPFVTVGSKVKKGDVLFVLESMKLMNEVKSEFDGEVVDILVENAQGVEYHQPIMIIK